MVSQRFGWGGTAMGRGRGVACTKKVGMRSWGMSRGRSVEDRADEASPPPPPTALTPPLPLAVPAEAPLAEAFHLKGGGQQPPQTSVGGKEPGARTPGTPAKGPADGVVGAADGWFAFSTDLGATDGIEKSNPAGAT